MISRCLSLPELLQYSEAKVARRVNSADLFAITGANSELRVHECFWPTARDPSRSLPTLVCPAGDDFETFFADALTFYADAVPVSAQFHVLSKKAKDWLLQRGTTRDTASSNPIVVDRFHKLSVALSITEALTELLEGGTYLEYSPYAICRRSLSFSLAKGASIYEICSSQAIADKWIELRKMAGMRFSPAVCMAMARIANIALSAKRSQELADDQVDLKLSNLFTGATSEQVFAEFLSRIYGQLPDYQRAYSGDFEGRITAFRNIVEVIDGKSRGKDLDAVSIAFFCNAILPGSLTHIELLIRMLSTRPTILVWYGFFAGVSNHFNWRAAGNGVGQKLFRDLQTPINLESPPSFDVSLDELRVLQELGLSEKVLKPVQRAAMLVSIAPGVEVFARLADERVVQSSRQVLQADFEMQERVFARNRQLRKLLAEAQNLLADELQGEVPKNPKGDPEIRPTRQKRTGRFFNK